MVMAIVIMVALAMPHAAASTGSEEDLARASWDRAVNLAHGLPYVSPMLAPSDQRRINVNNAGPTSRTQPSKSPGGINGGGGGGGGTGLVWWERWALAIGKPMVDNPTTAAVCFAVAILTIVYCLYLMMSPEGEDFGSFTRADLGCQVAVQGYACPGTLRFVGLHAVSGTPRCGVELELPLGKNDGTVRVVGCRALDVA